MAHAPRSRPLVLCALLCVLPFLAMPSPASAQGLYTVTGIAVDETAETEVLAKERGIAAAKREAFAEILRRLTIDPSTYVATADGDAPPPVVPTVPDDDRLEFMIRDLSLEDERFGGGRYIAEMTVRYQPEAVNQFLQRLGAPYLASPSPIAVILPIFRDSEGVKLWSDTNPWLDAWWSLDGAGTIVPYAVPLGDLSDISAIDVDRAIAVDAQAINAIAARYNAGAVLVPLATVSPDGSTVLVELSTFGAGWPSQAEVLTLGPPVLATEAATVDPEDAAPDPETERLRAAARLTLRAMENRWKAANILRFDQEAETLTARVDLTRFEDWLAARQALNSVAPIKNWHLLELSTRAAVVSIDFVGELTGLGQAFFRVSYALGPDPEATDRFILTKR
jgi:hypothetical protein